MRKRLTDGYVRKLPLAEAQQYAIRDLVVPGLMVVVGKRSRTFTLQHDLYSAGPRGKREKLKTLRKAIDSVENITVDEAREKAREMKKVMRQGIDPTAVPKGSPAEGWSVAEMFAHYADDMRKRGKSERTIADMMYRLDLYLKDWKPLPIVDIKPSMARAKHTALTQRGLRVANQALKDFRAAYNFAVRVCDEPDKMRPNAAKAVTFNKEGKSDKVLEPADLPEWWRQVHALPSKVRTEMFVLGLLSGLRPGKLAEIERAWIDLDHRAIRFPTMKSGRKFDLPLSQPMVESVQRALAMGEMLFPTSPWLFSTRSKKGDVIPVANKKERKMAGKLGHILRHTYRTTAQRIGLDPYTARMLLDHTVPGIEGVYIHNRALFDKLLIAQEEMSAALLTLCKAGEGFTKSAE